VNRSSLRRIAAPGVAAIALATALSACGAANENASSGSGSSAEGESSLSGELAGAGASSQERAQEAWSTAFQAANSGATVTYDPVGSGDGRTQFIEGGVAFAGSDAYLDDDEKELSGAKERCEGQDPIEVPAYVSPIAIVFNLEGVDELNLDAKTTAEIFDGKITTWNDPAIADLNPDAELPDERITPVHRSDDSGTTENFTDWLGQAGDGAWGYDADGVWPAKGGEAAEGTSGVISAVTNGTGTIGYADESQAGDLAIAKVKVGEEFVEATPEAGAKVIEESERVSGRPDVDMAFEINRTTDAADTYPVVLVSYLIACQSYSDQAEADLVKGYLSYIVSDEGQKAAADNAGAAALSSSVAEEAQAIVEKISAGS
jgi:phosphate transport system substrate-binding protein